MLIYFEEDKWVEQYTYRYDKDIGRVYMEIWCMEMIFHMTIYIFNFIYVRK